MYIPISRKYRPQDFDEIIGQEHITKTLKNAIAVDKVAHAYLFSGPRGIGKTSTARVFAKALNCEKGPTSKPCNKCHSCQEITKGINLDVLEIDGASNRGIDEIRNLRENVKLKPISGKFRIYIIDEVHMLTQEAFNALLKTLEEPPEHVKFIFATTRPYKVLPTILSRCQRFDFHLLSTETMMGTLRQIVDGENLKIQENALFLIAKNASGSMRDAQVMLDQVTSSTKEEIKGQDVAKMLGMLELDVLIEISEAVLTGNSEKILNLLHELINSGKDALSIAATLIEHFRNLMVMNSCRDSKNYVIADVEDRKRLEDLSRKFSIEELLYIIYTLSNTVDLINKTSLGKIPLEVALLKLSRKEKLIPISELLKQLKKIEGSSINRGISDKPLPYDEKITPNSVLDAPKENIGGDISVESRVADYSTDAQFQRLKGIWPEIIRAVKGRKVSAGTYLEEGYLMGLKNNKVIVGFPKTNSLHKEALESRQNVDIIVQTLKDFMEIDLNIGFVFSDTIEKSAPREPVDYGVGGSQVADVSKKVEPIIQSAVEKFKGSIVKQYYVRKEK